MPETPPPAWRGLSFPDPGRVVLAAGIWFLGPVFLLTLSLPFGFWDYLTAANIFHFGTNASWTGLLTNYVNQLVNASYFVRPTVGLLYDLQWLVFGGGFWLWFLVKWAVKIGAALLVYRLLRMLGCEAGAGWAGTAFALFHPAAVPLMLVAPDDLVSLGILAQIILLLPHDFDLARLGRGRLALFYVVFMLTLGAKEPAYVFAVLLLLCLAWRTTSLRWRLVPLVAFAALWTFSLILARNRATTLDPGRLLSVFSEQVGLLAPLSPLFLLHAILAGLAMFVVVRMFERREPAWLALALCLATAAGMLLFVSLTGVPTLRYAIAPIHLLAVILGVAVARLPPNPGRAAVIFFCAGYPLLTAGQSYTQGFYYQQFFYEEAEVLNRMEAAAAAGKTLALTGRRDDMGGEYIYSVQAFFERYAVEQYGASGPIPVQVVSRKGWPAGGFVLLSQLQPGFFDHSRGDFDVSRLERVESVRRVRYGAFERLTNFYTRFDALIGLPGQYRYDYGTLPPSPVPLFHLYYFRAACPQECGAVPPAPVIENLTPQRRYGAFGR